MQLLAVSKTHPSESLREMYAAGQRAFGENYLQEALEKIEALQDLEIEWHFIGHVQRNKTKNLAEKFDWVHGVDRLIIAERLSNQRLQDQSDLNICLQVNIDGQISKDGCAPDEVVELVAQISQLPKIRLRGLMVIPAPDNTAAFADAKALFDEVKGKHAHPQDWDTLSMGMSSDLEAAIAAGSTMVRVGTALFGARDYLQKG
ncbi:Pyridoxal phosphate homeostasis protein [compost metagenome]